MSNITALIPNPDKKDSIDVYADGELILSVDTDTVIEAGLHIGMPIDEDRLKEIDAKRQLVKAKHKAYNYLSYGDMSSKKLFDKLTRYGFEKDVADACVEAMTEQGFINDGRYANKSARYMAESKLYGPHRIINELTSRGIDRLTAEEAVYALDVDFEKNARVLANGKFLKERSKQISALMRYGYDYETVSAVITQSEEEDYE